MNKIGIDFEKFMLAGNATFTITSKKTNQHYSYKVTKTKGNKPVWYVHIQYRYNDYMYAGFITIQNGKYTFVKGIKGNCDNNDIRIISLLWTLRHANDSDIDEKLDIHHEGKCCKCGRPLTNPDSIELGIGPECAKMLG